MREAKKNISAEYLERLNASPYFIVVEYQGLKVDQFANLRERLDGAKAELHVVKNRIFNIAAKEAGVEADLAGDLKGQVAVVTGESEISAAAKIVKNFESEFEKPSIKFGYMGATRLEAAEVKVIADLPPLETLRGKILGVLQA
ncbi:MAG: 50S ribosomal protein L10, partial [Verrucomicrobiota bacterium]